MVGGSKECERMIKERELGLAFFFRFFLLKTIHVKYSMTLREMDSMRF